LLQLSSTGADGNSEHGSDHHSVPDVSLLDGGKESRAVIFPPFPPKDLQLLPALPDNIDEEEFSITLMCWTFLKDFGDLFGVEPCTFEQLWQAICDGEKSPLLGSIHVALLKGLLYDAEEAHRIMAAMTVQQERRGIAALLEEAWAWGFDTDTWRAHLSALTWPEVLRQYAVSAGYGGSRPLQQGLPSQPKRRQPVWMQQVGLPTHPDEDTGTGMPSATRPLHMPSRFPSGSVRALAWEVLSNAGPDGMPLVELTKALQENGLRDLNPNKAPEAVVAGALAREIVFFRYKPAMFCLRSLRIARMRAQKASEALVREAAKVKEEERDSEDYVVKSSAEEDVLKMEVDEQEDIDMRLEMEEEEGDAGDEDDEYDDEEDVVVEERPSEPWVKMLSEIEYNEMAVLQRLRALEAVVHGVLDGGIVRQRLEGRLHRREAIRKQLREELIEQRKKARPALLADPQSEGAAGEPPATPAPEDQENSPVLTEERRRERRQQLLWQSQEENPLRVEPLGADRRYNRYFHFGAVNGKDCLLVETQDGDKWTSICSCKQLDGLLACLNPKGAREFLLDRSIRRQLEQLKQSLSKEENATGSEENSLMLPTLPSSDNQLVEKEDTSANAQLIKGKAKKRSRVAVVSGMLSAPEDDLRLTEVERTWLWGADTMAAQVLTGPYAIHAQVQRGIRARTAEDEIVRCSWCQDAVRPQLEDHCNRTHLTFSRRLVTPTEFAAHVRRAEEQACHDLGISLSTSDPPALPPPPPPRLQKLKADILDVEAALPADALDEHAWEGRESWLAKVKAANTAADVRDVVMQLEQTVRTDALSPNFLRGPVTKENTVVTGDTEDADPSNEAHLPPPGAPWAPGGLPVTTSAVGLRLAALDAAIVYTPGEPPMRDSADVYLYSQPPVGALVETAEAAAESQPDDDDVDFFGRESEEPKRRRGRGGRPRGTSRRGRGGGRRGRGRGRRGSNRRWTSSYTDGDEGDEEFHPGLKHHRGKRKRGSTRTPTSRQARRVSASEDEGDEPAEENAQDEFATYAYEEEDGPAYEEGEDDDQLVEDDQFDEADGDTDDNPIEDPLDDSSEEPISDEDD